MPDDVKCQIENEQTKTEMDKCCEELSKPDYIMEASVIDTIKKFLIHGGQPETVIELLCNGWLGFAPTVNILVEMLLSAGVEMTEIRHLIQTTVANFIEENFDPDKADDLFFKHNEVPEWLSDLCNHPGWRSMLLNLAEKHPSCMMTIMTTRIMLGYGLEDRICSVKLASSDATVMVKVLSHFVSKLGRKADALWVMMRLPFIKDMVCYSDFTYTVCQLFLYRLINTFRSERRYSAASCLQSFADELESHGVLWCRPVEEFGSILSGGLKCPQLLDHVNGLLVSNAADFDLHLTRIDEIITEIMYDGDPLNAISIMRNVAMLICRPRLLDLLVGRLWTPIMFGKKDTLINIIAFTVAVCNPIEQNECSVVNLEESVNEICQIKSDLNGALSRCMEISSDPSRVPCHFAALAELCRIPVVSIGLIKWTKDFVVQKSDVYQAIEQWMYILDEIADTHSVHRPRIYRTLKGLLETTFELNTDAEMKIKRQLIVHMAYLLYVGYHKEPLDYVSASMKQGCIFPELASLFVTELSSFLVPPYGHCFGSILNDLLLCLTVADNNSREKRSMQSFFSSSQQQGS